MIGSGAARNKCNYIPESKIVLSSQTDDIVERATLHQLCGRDLDI